MSAEVLFNQIPTELSTSGVKNARLFVRMEAYLAERKAFIKEKKALTKELSHARAAFVREAKNEAANVASTAAAYESSLNTFLSFIGRAQGFEMAELARQRELGLFGSLWRSQHKTLTGAGIAAGSYFMVKLAGPLKLLIGVPAGLVANKILHTPAAKWVSRKIFPDSKTQEASSEGNTAIRAGADFQTVTGTSFLKKNSKGKYQAERKLDGKFISLSSRIKWEKRIRYGLSLSAGWAVAGATHESLAANIIDHSGLGDFLIQHGMWHWFVNGSSIPEALGIDASEASGFGNGHGWNNPGGNNGSSWGNRGGNTGGTWGGHNNGNSWSGRGWNNPGGNQGSTWGNRGGNNGSSWGNHTWNNPAGNNGSSWGNRGGNNGNSWGGNHGWNNPGGNQGSTWGNHTWNNPSGNNGNSWGNRGGNTGGGLQYDRATGRWHGGGQTNGFNGQNNAPINGQGGTNLGSGRGTIGVPVGDSGHPFVNPSDCGCTRQGGGFDHGGRHYEYHRDRGGRMYGFPEGYRSGYDRATMWNIEIINNQEVTVVQSYVPQEHVYVAPPVYQPPVETPPPAPVCPPDHVETTHQNVLSLEHTSHTLHHLGTHPAAPEGWNQAMDSQHIADAVRAAKAAGMNSEFLKAWEQKLHELASRGSIELKTLDPHMKGLWMSYADGRVETGGVQLDLQNPPNGTEQNFDVTYPSGTVHHITMTWFDKCGNWMLTGDDIDHSTTIHADCVVPETQGYVPPSGLDTNAEASGLMEQMANIAKPHDFVITLKAIGNPSLHELQGGVYPDNDPQTKAILDFMRANGESLTRGDDNTPLTQVLQSRYGIN